MTVVIVIIKQALVAEVDIGDNNDRERVTTLLPIMIKVIVKGTKLNILKQLSLNKHIKSCCDGKLS